MSLLSEEAGNVTAAAAVESSSEDGDDDDSESEAPGESVDPINEMFAAFQESAAEAEEPTQQDCEDMAEREITLYEKVEVMKHLDAAGEKNDPLLWWKGNQLLFPTLPKLARIYLSIPATSAPTERIFSKAGLFITNRRGRLAPKLAGMLITLKSMLDWLDERAKEKAEKERKEAAESELKKFKKD